MRAARVEGLPPLLRVLQKVWLMMKREIYDIQHTDPELHCM